MCGYYLMTQFYIIVALRPKKRAINIVAYYGKTSVPNV